MFPPRSHTNRAVVPQKMAGGLKFGIKKVEGLYFLCSENKDADQLLGACLCFRIYAKSRFSHDMALMMKLICQDTPLLLIAIFDALQLHSITQPVCHWIGILQ